MYNKSAIITIYVFDFSKLESFFLRDKTVELAREIFRKSFVDLGYPLKIAAKCKGVIVDKWPETYELGLKMKRRKKVPCLQVRHLEGNHVATPVHHSK